MPDENTTRELSDLLGQLRWTLTGARAGGVLDWARAPSGKQLEAGPREEPNEEPRLITPAPPGDHPHRERMNPVPPLSETPRAPHPPASHAPDSTCSAEFRGVEPHRTGGATRIPAAAKQAPPSEDQEAATSDPRQSCVPTPPSTQGPESLQAALSEIRASLGDCGRCGLHSARRNLVFGEGSAHSGLVFVGEGPGYEEDQQGRPFVGRAGKLLDKMIQAIGLKREDVFICNVVKCRPPENRTPVPDEVAACSPFLFRQLEALRPKAICALGVSAAQTILGNTRPISALRGRIHFWRGYPLICTYHPAYLLRSSHQKAAAWQDLKEVRRLLDPAP